MECQRKSNENSSSSSSSFLKTAQPSSLQVGCTYLLALCSCWSHIPCTEEILHFFVAKNLQRIFYVLIYWIPAFFSGALGVEKRTSVEGPYWLLAALPSCPRPFNSCSQGLMCYIHHCSKGCWTKPSISVSIFESLPVQCLIWRLGFGRLFRWLHLLICMQSTDHFCILRNNEGYRKQTFQILNTTTWNVLGVVVLGYWICPCSPPNLFATAGVGMAEERGREKEPCSSC